ncbi:MAG: hypothetical protein AB7D02_02170 [Candidatus Paceibacterota bacterium]
MTIIYYHQKRKRKFYLKKENFQKSFFKKTIFFLKSFSRVPTFGFIKTTCFFVFPAVFIFLIWLILFSQNISLNYQIYKLKKEIKNLDRELSFIKEKNSDSFSQEELEKWLSLNKFTEVNQISYLEISDDLVTRK